MCVATDRVLRLIEDGARLCPTNERRLELALWKEEKPEAPEAEQEDEPTEREDREEGTETQRFSSRITAPFEVVDEAGDVIFRVVDDGEEYRRGAYIERNGNPAISLAAPAENAWIMVHEPGGVAPVALLGSSEGKWGHLQLYENALPALELHGAGVDGPILSMQNGGGQPGLLLTAQSAGGQLDMFNAQGQIVSTLGPGTLSNNPSLRFLAGSNMAAAIGIDSKGQGAVQVMSENGVLAEMIAVNGAGGVVRVMNRGSGPAAALNASDGKGFAQIYTTGGEVVSTLSQGVYGGLLQLNSNAGQPMVEAGNNGNVGLVRAGPISASTSGVPGLPGSYILGKR